MFELVRARTFTRHRHPPHLRTGGGGRLLHPRELSAHQRVELLRCQPPRPPLVPSASPPVGSPPIDHCKQRAHAEARSLVRMAVKRDHAILRVGGRSAYRRVSRAAARTAHARRRAPYELYRKRLFDGTAQHVARTGG